jgi:branched-chain amino acid transport system permease protein
MTPRLTTRIGLVAFGVLLAVAPLVVRRPYYQSIMVVIGINALAVTGLNLLMGYAGQVSLGHAAFVGIGGYGSAILTVNHGVNPWLAILAGVAVTCVVAWIIGVPTLRLHGHYLAIATLGFGIIVNIVFVEWRALTGGQSGIAGLPELRLAGIALDSHLRLYYVVWGCVYLATIATANIQHSRVGRALRAISSSEVAAQTAGINTGRYKVQVFVLSAALAAVAGSMTVHYMSFANPEPFGFAYSIELVVMAVLGGAGNVWGPAVGAGAITLLTEVLQPLGNMLRPSGADLHVPAFGLILVLMLVFLPRGVTTSLALLAQRVRGVRRAG